MTFVVTTELDRPRDEVWRAFGDPDNLRKWQPTLVAAEPLVGTPGTPGAVRRLTYLENGRAFAMTETIIDVREPEQVVAAYESGMGTNHVVNRLTDLGGGRTEWVLGAEFKFTGPMRLFGWTLRGVIRKRLEADAARFKRKLEAGELAT